ncbi:hypothetical protein [Desulfuromonas sp. TF]|uniref:hypothetical protein n=1 Tax=Desulfuromonas sp. TF TaxID=1232410 RepID=UPI000416EA9A|nr:hypothetical protein [Desulfuromonas sp. TF]
MSKAKNGLLYMEDGSTPQGYVLMVDSGDRQHFGVADVDIFSGDPEAVVRPNGVVTGLNLLSVAAGGGNDLIDVKAFTVWLAGVETAVAADADVAVTRPATDVAKINSITLDDAGDIVEVAGTDSLSSAFSATRGAAGGPPFIPVGSIELGQVRLTTTAAAPIAAAEIFQGGEYTERAISPTPEIDATGRGDWADDAATARAHVKFASVLPAIHTGSVAKRVYLSYSDPIFGEVSRSADFTPAEESYSTSTSEHYGGADNTESTSLGQAGFTAKLLTGVDDAVVGAKGKIRTFKFLPDKNKAGALITQGRVATARTFAVAGQKQASVSIAATKATVEYFA